MVLHILYHVLYRSCGVDMVAPKQKTGELLLNDTSQYFKPCEIYYFYIV